jgi:protein tyrosine phosphatase (PTP) superfamily phosphohydrolase (DUF442 family)
VGIPGFTEAKAGVSSGLRPTLEGLDWLKAKGYRTALYVRRPGEEDAGDRKAFESRCQMLYLTVEVSPQALTPAAVERFNRIVADAENRPLFVYDREGMLAGALWYLHFRTAEGLSDEEARRKAAALGLKEDESGPHREMWLAIQKYLSENKP